MKFMDLVRSIMHATPTATPQQIATKLWGEAYTDIRELATTVIVAADHADTNRSGSLDRREVVSFIITGALSALGLRTHTPDWLVNWLIEDVVQQLRIPDFEVKIPAAPGTRIQQ